MLTLDDVEVLHWDGGEETIREFSRGQFAWMNTNGTATLRARHGYIHHVRPGDILIRIKGDSRTPLMFFFQESPWPGLLFGPGVHKSGGTVTRP